VSVSAALGLPEERDGRYSLTHVVEDYLLEEAGFSDIEVTPTFGYYSIVIRRKPG
jgi:hypothetical protein